MGWGEGSLPGRSLGERRPGKGLGTQTCDWSVLTEAMGAQGSPGKVCEVSRAGLQVRASGGRGAREQEQPEEEEEPRTKGAKGVEVLSVPGTW